MTASAATQQQPQNLTYSQALEYLKEGFQLARLGWNGKGMFVYYVEGSTFPRRDARGVLKRIADQTDKNIVRYRPHLDMCYADGSFGVWVASHSDMIARDWYVVA